MFCALQHIRFYNTAYQHHLALSTVGFTTLLLSRRVIAFSYTSMFYAFQRIRFYNTAYQPHLALGATGFITLSPVMLLSHRVNRSYNGVEGAFPIFRHFPAAAGLTCSVHWRLPLDPCIWTVIAANRKRLLMCSWASVASQSSTFCKFSTRNIGRSLPGNGSRTSTMHINAICDFCPRLGFS